MTDSKIPQEQVEPFDAKRAVRFEGFVSKCLLNKDLAKMLFAKDHDALKPELLSWGFTEEQIGPLTGSLDAVVDAIVDGGGKKAIEDAARLFNKDQNAGT